MTTYTLTNGTDVIRDNDGARIHADPTLFDWQAYQAWLADGNTPNPYEPPPPPPLVLDYRQFRALFTAAENQAIMTAAPSNPQLLDWLLEAAPGSIDMSSPIVKGGLDALVAAGLLTADREAAILAGTPPP